MAENHLIFEGVPSYTLLPIEKMSNQSINMCLLQVFIERKKQVLSRERKFHDMVSLFYMKSYAIDVVE